MNIRTAIPQKKPAISSLGKSTFQAKLRIGPANDVYEREADRTADRVMRGPVPSGGISGGPSDGLVRRKCAACEEEEKKTLQRKEGGASSGPATAPPIVHDVLSGSGRPLDPSVRSFMEPRFGHDFGNVRIHTDSRAAESARSVNALAYTVGDTVVFGDGAYRPGTESGRRLIAHELTHVVQQGGGGTRLQRAETDTSKNCAKLSDTKSDVNTKVNASIAAANAGAGKPVNAVKVVQGVRKDIGSDTSVGRTAIEDWAGGLGSKKVDLPAQSSTKYSGVSYGIWSNPFFPILNPTMKVNGICIGSDKLGHFFQQGFDYFAITQTSGKTVADAEEFGERTEGGGFGLTTTGVFSNADLEANKQGLKFYKDLLASPSMTFDIASYISSKWNEESNPSFYEDAVGKKVWSNLLTGKWSGTFTSASGPTSISVDLSVTTAGAITGSYSYTGSGGAAVTGTIPSGTVTYLTSSVRGTTTFGSNTTKTPVSGVTLDFVWEQGGQKGKALLSSTGESKLKGTWGIADATGGGTWEMTR